MHPNAALVAAGALALSGAAHAAAVAIPAELRPRAQDVTVKFYSHTSCSFKGGPARGYDRNTCLPLPRDSHGLRITDHNPGCWITKYGNGNCGGGSYNMDSLDVCYDIGDEWNSIKFWCN